MVDSGDMEVRPSIRLSVLLAAALAPAALRAATIRVSPSGDGTDGASWATAYATIEAGVAAAADGDTVVLDDGTFALAGDLTVSKAVTITSRNDKDATVIDVNGAKLFKFAKSGGKFIKLDSDEPKEKDEGEEPEAEPGDMADEMQKPVMEVIKIAKKYATRRT